ncbi:MAG: hypothetical protein AAEJ04_09290 [Planctomycetota bacterium]
MIRITTILTFTVFSMMTSLIFSGCGSAPERETTVQNTYGRTPLKAQPLQLSAGVAPAISQGSQNQSETDNLAIPEPVVARVIEEIAAKKAADPIAEKQPEVLTEPIITEPIINVAIDEKPDPVDEIQPTEVTATEVISAEVINAVARPTEVTAAEIIAEKETQISEKLDPRNVDTLILMTGPGKLIIEQDTAATDFTFSAEVISRGQTLDRARSLATGADIVIDQTAPGRPRVRIVEPRLENGEECQIDLTVKIPLLQQDRFALDIQDSLGDIDISGFSGELSITSLRGALAISSSGGSLDISSGKGPCDVRGFAGPVKIRDGEGNCTLSEISGDVEVWGRGGSLEVRYISGVVTVIDAREGVTVQSIEGNLNLYGVPLGDSVIEGVSGSVVSKTGAP